MNIQTTSLPGVLLIEPKVFSDARGVFMETYQRERYAAAGICGLFVQDNLSHSTRGVLRGLHYQQHYPQGKLVSVSRGEVFDVAVDIRYGSSTFGKWFGVVLSEANYRQMYVPPGFAHGFCVLSEVADFVYKCTDFYRPGDEGGVAWNDPDIGIEWPLTEPILSEKDQRYPRLVDLAESRLPHYQSNPVT
jgi:dTDP-4-dehydrorhamnose 3,5-epimerase